MWSAIRGLVLLLTVNRLQEGCEELGNSLLPVHTFTHRRSVTFVTSLQLSLKEADQALSLRKGPQ